MQIQDNLQSRRILGYDDLVQVTPGNSQESLVDVRLYDASIIASYNKLDMYEYTGDSILVRDSLARKLAAVNSVLVRLGYHLRIVYGYRHPEVQQVYFDKRRTELRDQYPNLDGDVLDRMTHNFVAIPNVGGHPTGGAVDLTIVDSKMKELDMGTMIADYTDPYKIQTDGPGLTSKQTSNRKLLHDLMVSEGFAPFYGEWWHFSYGDREWGAFYNKKAALYSAITM